MFSISRKNRGFSLAELLVVIAVVGILAVIIFPYYGSARGQLALQRSANKLVQDIRRAQGMALGTEEVGGGVLQGGYGIYINKSEDDKYYIYVDVDGNQRYNSGDQKIETIFLEKEVFIQGFIPSSANFSINFKPPDPIINIKDEPGIDKENVTIVIAQREDSSKTKTIVVNKAGLIYVE